MNSEHYYNRTILNMNYFVLPSRTPLDRKNTTVTNTNNNNNNNNNFIHYFYSYIKGGKNAKGI